MENTVAKLRKATTVDDLVRLRARVRTHAEMLDEESLSSPHIDYTRAQQVASALCQLIDGSDTLGADDRALLGAAAQYFVLTEDEASDLDVDGLLDDAAVVRFVCEQLERSDVLTLIG